MVLQCGPGRCNLPSKIIYLFAGLTLIISFPNCGYVGPSDPDAFMSPTTSTPSTTTNGTFTWIKSNIIQSQCIWCHSGAGAQAGYNMSTYSGVITRTTPFDSTNSLFYQKISDGSMPKDGDNLSTEELNAVKTWIDGGAQNN